MNSYTIRIELKGQTEKMRIELLFAMMDNGFSSNVVCDGDFTYALPLNEFVCVGPEKITSLMNRILRLLGNITENPVILITRSEERCWSGLRVINL